MGRLLVDSATKLASLGAKFAICPDNTVHQAIDLGCAESPIPWLHIAEAVTREAVRIGAKRVGILGTRYLMEGPVYPRVLKAAGIEPQLPKASHRVAIHEIIFGDLVYGRVTDETRSRLQAIVADLQAQGCDAVVLGCTELPLAISPELSPLPTLDSTRLLARAAIRRAIHSPAV